MTICADCIEIDNEEEKDKKSDDDLDPITIKPTML